MWSLVWPLLLSVQEGWREANRPGTGSMEEPRLLPGVTPKQGAWLVQYNHPPNQSSYHSATDIGNPVTGFNTTTLQIPVPSC